MKRMKKPTECGNSSWTLGELVSLAFDVSPDPETALKLLGVMLGGRAIQFSDELKSGG